MLTFLSSWLIVIFTSPSVGVYLKAFDSRLTITLSKLVRSIHTGSFSSLCMNLNLIFLALAWYSNILQMSFTKPMRSVSRILIFIIPFSIFLKSIIWLMRWIIRSALRFIVKYAPVLRGSLSSFSNDISGAMISVIGVRISWLMFMKNFILASLISSAWICSCRFSLSSSLRFLYWIYWYMPNNTNARYIRYASVDWYHGVWIWMLNSLISDSWLFFSAFIRNLYIPGGKWLKLISLRPVGSVVHSSLLILYE